MPAIGTNSLYLHLQHGMIGLGFRIVISCRKRCHEDVFDRNGGSGSIDQHGSRLAVRRNDLIGIVQCSVGQPRNSLERGVQPAIFGSQRGSVVRPKLFDAAAVFGRIVSRIANVVGLGRIAGFAVSSGLRAADESRSEFDGPDAGPAVPMQADGHPCLDSAGRRRVILRRIVRKFFVGHAIGRVVLTHPAPLTRCEIHRQRTITIRLDLQIRSRNILVPGLQFAVGTEIPTRIAGT